MTDEKTTATHLLGLQGDGEKIKGALLLFQKGRAKIERLFEVASDEKQEPLQLPTNDKELLIVTGLEAHQLLIRPLEIKLRKEKEINSVFAFQAEPLLPYPLEQAILDKIYLDKGKESVVLSLFATRKDHLSNHLDFWKARQVDPEVVSCIPFALATFARHCTSVQQPLFIAHLEDKMVSCAMATEGKLFGAHAFFLKESDKEGDLLQKGIMQAYYALARQVKGEISSHLLLTGKENLITLIAESLAQALNKLLIVPSDPNGQTTRTELQHYAIPIGLALTALPNGYQQVNFRQSKYAYTNPWKRYKKAIATYLVLSLLLSVCLFFFGRVWLGYQEDALKEQYGSILSLVHKTVDSFEEEFRHKKKLPLPLPEETPSHLLKSFSREELSERLFLLDQQLQEIPDIFPLLPNVPRVSDLLAWLSTHGAIATRTSDDATWQPLLQLENLHYSMIKRPELGKRQERYQVKVELEFTSQTPKIAREFHDALIAPNDFVDPKGEIKWNSNRGKYYASFFLKDKTLYTLSGGG